MARRRNYKRDRLGRFARTSGAGRSIRRGAGRGALAGSAALTATPIVVSAAAGGKITALGLAGSAIQGGVFGGPAGALAGAAVAGGVIVARRRRRR